MLRVVLLAAGLIATLWLPRAAFAAAASARPLTIADGFEIPAADSTLGAPWARGGNTPASTVRLDTLAHSGRRAARLRMADSAGFVAIVRTVPDSLRSGRVALRLRGWLRTEGAGRAGLWARVQGQNGTLALDDMSDRGPRGTTAWTRAEVLLPIVPETHTVTFGVLVRGGGTVWADDLTLELFTPAQVPASAPEATAYLRAALDSLRVRILRSADVDWPAVRKRAGAMLVGARVPAGTYLALRDAAARLGAPTRFVTRAERAREDSLAAASVERRGLWPRLDRLDGWCGYVDLKGLRTRDPALVTRYADWVHAGFRNLDSLEVCGYIIDLRRADAVDPAAMFAALAPVLGDSVLGAEVRPDGTRARWSCERGSFVRTTGRTRTVAARATSDVRLRRAHPPVAVLVGPGTSGAGEAVAAAFAGRAETRFFGTATAGLGLGVSTVRLRDGAVLEVAAMRLEDRTGRLVGGPLLPDEVDAGEPARPGYREPIIETALDWLRHQSGCRTPQ